MAGNSDLFVNKVFGAVLATGLVILGLQTVSSTVFTPAKVAKPGYAIEVQEASTGEAAAVDVIPDWGTVLPTADVAAGQTVSTKCASCHTFTAGGPDQTGPNLYGVLGRKPGSKPGFAYSSAMVDFGNKVGKWDYDHFFQFVHAPQGYINGTKMTFVGLKKPDERINLIAWLRQQSASPLPIPAPNPKAAAAAAAPAGAPAANVTGSTPAAAPSASGGTPAGAATGAPATSQTSNPTGQTPASGAAAAPSTATTTNPGGKKN